MKSTIVNENGRRSITVFTNGEVYVASDTQRNFDKIVELAAVGDEKVVDLFDLATTVAKRFERLTPRLAVENGNVKFDGDVINNVLTDQIVRFLDEGEDDWVPLAAFIENVYQNPSPISRDELCDWVGNRESLTITEDGYIVGYKGCHVDGNGVAISTVAAPESDKVTVNDEPIVGYVPNKPGDVVEMPRSVVDPNQARHCSKGLHIGTFAYANGYKGSGGVVLEVHVNPRDVVSVTSDSDRQKIRACRYEVIKTVTQKYEQTVIPAPVQGRRDTRDNHLNQKRYPAGTYINGVNVSGRFIPKSG